MSKPILYGMSLEQLEHLAQTNSTNRALLAEIRAQFVRRAATRKAQAITRMLADLSSHSSARSDSSSGVLNATMKFPELQRYFRQQAFHDTKALGEMLEILRQRDGQASQNLADEVSARIRQLQTATPKVDATQARVPPTQPKVPQAPPMDQARYSSLFQTCQAGTATPEQVQLLLAELDRRQFPKNHPIREALQLGIKPPTPSVAQDVAKITPRHEPSKRIPVNRGFNPTPPIHQSEVPLTGNPAWLEERKKAREARRRERAVSLHTGFIEIKPRPNRQMIEVYLGSPERLIATVAKMKRVATRTRTYQGITEVELAAAMIRLTTKSWKDEGERRRDRRLLPYLLLAGSPANVSRHGLGPFVDELDQDDRLTPLKEMIQQYFHADFEHYPEPRKALGAWIREKLSSIDLRKCRRAWVHHYYQHRGLFAADPVSFAAGFLPPSRPDWKDWEELNLPSQSWIYGDALAEGVRRAMKDKASCQLEDLYGHLQRTMASDVTGNNTRIVNLLVESLDVRRKCIEAALLEHVRLRTSSPDSPLVAFALDTLKDPRQKDSAHWYGVKAEATALMQGWLSIEDLELFFGELADDSDEKSRVQYWKPFVLNRQVSSSRIFLGESVIRRKRKKVEKYLQTGRYGRLFGSGSDEVCAFVLRIKDAIIVEFSKVNNACYVYDARRFDPNLMGAKTVSITDLKNAAVAQRLSHTPNWANRFDEELYREYGIRRPTR